MIPYIHLNLGGSNLNNFSQWTFPILRAVGGFLTASMMQIVIERRIDSLIARYLARSEKSEMFDHAGEGPGEIPGTTSNAKRPPGLDDAQGSREAPSDVNSRRAGQDIGTGDVEKGLSVPTASDSAIDSRPHEHKPGDLNPPQQDATSGRNSALDCVFLVLLLVGILSSVVGYVGCFSVVQNATSHTGPLSWLCLETGLSVIRVILWGLNPKGDDAPPLELILRLDHGTILPTCNVDETRILQQKVLPLTRSSQFLNMVTSFAGLVERFTHPDLTLYYTLTRKQIMEHPDETSSPVEPDEAISPENQDEAGSLERSDEAGKRVLYITIFDHKERTTRVYTRDGTIERLYSTESDVPLIDLRHSLLETKLCNEIISTDDLITGDPEIHALLRTHYQSIIDQIHFTIGETYNTTTNPPPPSAYAIENKWTLKAVDTVGARERRRREETVKLGLERTWEFTVGRGRTIEVDGSQPMFERDRLYLEHGRTEAMRQSLDITRGQWIDRYMQLVTREARERLKGETIGVRRVDGQQAVNESVVGGDEELQVVVEERLIYERCLMEKLLVHEVEAWEGLVLNRVKEFIGRNDVPESAKGQLAREWRGNCWKRLNTDVDAMDSRMDRVKTKISALLGNTLQRTLNARLEEAHAEIREAWQSVIERLLDTLTTSVSSTPSSRFNRDIRKKAHHPKNRTNKYLFTL